MSVALMDCPMHVSPGYAAVCAGVHLAAALALLASRLPPAMIAILVALLLVSCVRDLRRTAWRTSSRAVCRLRETAAGWWLLERGGTRFGPARPVHARVWPRCVLLTLRTGDGARRRVVLPGDALHPDDLRRVRVRLLAALRSGCA